MIPFFRGTQWKFPDLSHRAELVEEMDRADSPEDRLFRTLAQFDPINRRFSRYRTLFNRYVLSDMTSARPRRLLDLGAGGCDIGRWLIRQCRKRGLELSITAMEHDPRVARYARAACRDYPEIEVVEQDIRDPLPLAKVDYVFANHLLHHLPDQACIALIRQIDRAAPRRYLLSDMLRSFWAYCGFALYTAPFFRDSFLVTDGLASIRRSFTLAEVGALLHAAQPVNSVVLHRLMPCRFAVIGGTAL